MPVEPNHVYVIPPNVDMTISQRILRLTPRTEKQGHHMPVDRFLAIARGGPEENGIGVILSGTASTVRWGWQRSRTEGGITFARMKDRPNSMACHRARLLPAVWIFRLAAGRIARSWRGFVPPYLATSSSSKTAELVPDGDPNKDILQLLRRANGVDFSDYKPATVKRRILRRMALHKVGELKGYVQFLQHHPAEVEALYEDILIKVTSFFRDPDAFEALKTEVFPSILKRRSPEEPIRVWVPGCSTGEETYSQAMRCSSSWETDAPIFPSSFLARPRPGKH